MPINFNDLNVRRVIMHNIVAKTLHQDHATATYVDNLFNVQPEVVDTIKQRLIDAAGRNSKAFELEIGETEQGSFYEYCKQIKTADDNEFIEITKSLADLLAESQDRTSIPGGYIIIIDAVDSITNHAIYIVIKAELHEALKYNIIGGVSQIELLDKIFLSPSQKLYKIGILFEKILHDSENANEKFGAFLFDDQFRTDGHPAEYFYKSFLGFAVDKNSKIQSKRFYDKTEGFILTNISNYELKLDLLRVLRSQFTVAQAATITPSEFAREYIPAGDLYDKYYAEVASELPNTFVKDNTLLKSILNNKKISFPRDIKVVGPDRDFDFSVKIINTQDEIRDLNTNSPDYTIIKINGKPYQDE